MLAGFALRNLTDDFFVKDSALLFWLLAGCPGRASLAARGGGRGLMPIRPPGALEGKLFAWTSAWLAWVTWGWSPAPALPSSANNVVCVDNDPRKIAMLNRDEVPIYEPGLEEMVAKNRAEGRLVFTTDLREGLKKALVVFIAVGTPEGQNGEADLTYVWQVGRSIAETMEDYKVVVTKSTVPVGTGHRLEEIIRQGQANPLDFDVVSNPEFLREGSAIEDFMRPNRVVIGARNERAKAIMRDLYRPLFLIETPFVITDTETAEMIKYASNAFWPPRSASSRDGQHLRTGGADVTWWQGMGLDQRIAPSLHAGPASAAPASPRTRGHRDHRPGEGLRFQIVEAVMAVNQAQRPDGGENPPAAGGSSRAGDRLPGAGFKPNTDDMRDSPSLPSCRRSWRGRGGARLRSRRPGGGLAPHARVVGGNNATDQGRRRPPAHHDRMEPFRTWTGPRS